MKSHLTSSTTRQHADDHGSTDVTVAGGSLVSAPAQARPHLTLVHTRLWSHTLILRGNLDRASAPELEDEIECLDQEGVTTLTLDLRQLDAIDPEGAALIASHSASFRRRGRDLAVLVGSSDVHRALADAGGTDLLTGAPAEGRARLISSASSPGTAPDLSTRMTKDLGLT